MGELEGIRMVIIEIGECIAMLIMLVKCWDTWDPFLGATLPQQIQPRSLRRSAVRRFNAGEPRNIDAWQRYSDVEKLRYIDVITLVIHQYNFGDIVMIHESYYDTSPWESHENILKPARWWLRAALKRHLYRSLKEQPGLRCPIWGEGVMAQRTGPVNITEE